LLAGKSLIASPASLRSKPSTMDIDQRSQTFLARDDFAIGNQAE